MSILLHFSSLDIHTDNLFDVVGCDNSALVTTFSFAYHK